MFLQPVRSTILETLNKLFLSIALKGTYSNWYANLGLHLPRLQVPTDALPKANRVSLERCEIIPMEVGGLFVEQERICMRRAPRGGFRPNPLHDIWFLRREHFCPRSQFEIGLD